MLVGWAVAVGQGVAGGSRGVGVISDGISTSKWAPTHRVVPELSTFFIRLPSPSYVKAARPGFLYLDRKVVYNPSFRRASLDDNGGRYSVTLNIRLTSLPTYPEVESKSTSM